MNTYPKIFKVHSIGNSGIAEYWTNELASKACDPIPMAIPPEFEGPGGAYSPEDLYAMSLMNCYLATFKFIAEKSKLVYANINGAATLYVDKGDEKAPWMERVEIIIKLSGCLQLDRAKVLLEKTKSQCMIINSVKTKVDFEFIVE